MVFLVSIGMALQVVLLVRPASPKNLTARARGERELVHRTGGAGARSKRALRVGGLVESVRPASSRRIRPRKPSPGGSLALLAVPPAVGADFGQDKWPSSRRPAGR